MSAISMPSKPMIPQDSALRVVKGSISASLAATAGGSLYGLMKAQPATMYAFQSGANTFVFAFPFFALREYVVSPMLEQDPETASIHTKNVLSSAISGTVVGGAMSAYFRGPQKFVSGSTTFGLLCTSMQLIGNELRVLRVHMLAGRGAGNNSSSSEVSVDSPVTSLRKPDLQSPSRPVDSPPQPQPLPDSTDTSTTERTTSWLQKAGSYLSAFSPVKKISDEDYYEQLKARRRQVVEKLEEVDDTIASDEARIAQHKV